MAENTANGAGKDPAEAADNPAEALVKDGADMVPDGTGDLNAVDDQVEVHASISEGMNSETKNPETRNSGSGSDAKDGSA